MTVLRFLLVAAWLAALPSISNASSAVWKVSKGDSTLYLGGTIHMLSENDFPLPQSYEQAFARSRLIIFETDINALSNPVFIKRMTEELVFTDGRELSDVLAADKLEKLNAHLKGFGVEPKFFHRYRPAGLAVTLTLFEYQRRGYTEQGVDAFYWQRALKAGKEVSYLETLDEQVGFIRAMHSVNSDKMVERILEESAMFDEVANKIYRGWKEGDLALIESAGLSSMRDDFPEIYKVMVSNRNEHWVNEIHDLLETERTEFVLVGAAHMAGPDGLIIKLKELGYTVEQQP